MPATAASTTDHHVLARFVGAQDRVYDDVRRELRNGRKQSHWMWFVFPQIAGLGQSSTARRFSISSLDEARAYLAHPLLGPRLNECTQLVLDVEGGTVQQIFGTPDWMKFHSSMTLFAEATAGASIFTGALDKYFAGQRDSATLAILSGAQSAN